MKTSYPLFKNPIHFSYWDNDYTGYVVVNAQQKLVAKNSIIIIQISNQSNFYKIIDLYGFQNNGKETVYIIRKLNKKERECAFNKELNKDAKKYTKRAKENHKNL